MKNPAYLLDVNALLALLDELHVHHQMVFAWFDAESRDWATCAFTESAFLRLATNRVTGTLRLEEAIEVLRLQTQRPGHRFWPINEGWEKTAGPLKDQMLGHQQITDAYLLGLAIKENGILVTLDKGIRHLAGERYSKNVLVLE